MLCFTTIAFCSCVNTRWLKTKEYLLYQQNIVGNEKVSSDELALLYKQLPNRKLPIIGSTLYLYLHLLGREFYFTKKIKADSVHIEKRDSTTRILFFNNCKKILVNNDSVLSKKDSIQLSKLDKKHLKRINKIAKLLKDGNFMMRTVGEAPSLFDTTKIIETTKQMHLYLKTKGYLKNEVNFDTNRLGKNYFVKYNIKEGEPSVIDSIKYLIADTAISNIINSNYNSNLINLKSNYDEKNLNDERERLYKLLRDNGYYDFNRQFINFEIDTTNINKLVVSIFINSPENSQNHIRYVVDKVIYNFDYSNLNRNLKDSSQLNFINYYYFNNKYSTKVLDSKNTIKINSFYNYSNSASTQKNISNLDIYKFVGVNYIKSDTLGNKLTAIVNATSLPKYQLSDEWGINVGQGQGYPGPLANLTFINRNVLGGCEIFAINLRGAVEGQPSLTKLNEVYRTYEYGGSVSITSPKILIPSRFKYKFNNNNPKTKYIFSYQNTIRNEYTRGIIKGSINYIFQKGDFARITITPLDLSTVNTTKIETSFNERLIELKSKGNNLQNSFSRSFISNFTFNYQFSNGDNISNKNSSYYKLTAELGGFTLHALNQLVGEKNNIILHDNKFLELNVFKYYRFASDYRKYIAISKHNMIAYRFNAGFISPFGGSTDVPYEKYFFAGGSNSVRAWQPRRLGPGAFKEINSNGEYSYETERQGTILLETALETRFKIFRFIDGALFIDAGNIWNNLPNTTEISMFNVNTFYKQIAIGAGYGLRFNFTFFIVRFDFGYKMWDPSRPSGEMYRGNKINFNNPFGETNQMVFQLGIGYPF